MATDNDYIFGTHDEESMRLGLQHTVWRPRATDAWHRAGFGIGQTIIDVGCGPGYASLDLAEIVGPGGRIHAIDRSRRFLNTLANTSQLEKKENITTHEIDLNTEPLPLLRADGAWCRWVFAFVTDPRALLEHIRTALKPGGVLVFHEYFCYTTWRMVPRSEEHDEFVRAVMAGWRADGGEPEIGIDLAGWLGEMGAEIVSKRPIVEFITPRDFLWQWPKSFIAIGLQRLVAIGKISADRAAVIQAAFSRRESLPEAMMITPGVMEVIARMPMSPPSSGSR